LTNVEGGKEFGETDDTERKGTCMAESLITNLLADHQKAKALLERFDDLPMDRREEGFWDLTLTLVQHEVAEEEILYPAVRRYVDGGDDLAGGRIEEQSAAELLLAEMEHQLPNDTVFMQNFANLRDAVLEHATAEEETVFPELASAVDADELAHLGKLYEKAKASAPTRPHPHAPDTAPGKVIVGPVAAVVDRIRDAIRKVV